VAAYVPPIVVFAVFVDETVSVSATPVVPMATATPDANVKRPEATSMTASSVPLVVDTANSLFTDATFAAVKESRVAPPLTTVIKPDRVTSPADASEPAVKAIDGMRQLAPDELFWVEPEATSYTICDELDAPEAIVKIIDAPALLHTNV